jgi:hypothetical protein
MERRFLSQISRESNGQVFRRSCLGLENAAGALAISLDGCAALQLAKRDGDPENPTIYCFTRAKSYGQWINAFIHSAASWQKCHPLLGEMNEEGNAF